MKKQYGYCAMAADFIHYGHIEYLRKCSALCKHLIVGLMTDCSIKKYKLQYPIQNYQQRKKVLLAIKYIYKVIPQSEFEFSDNGQLMALKEMYKDNLIIFDSTEHKRKGADKYFARTKDITSSSYKERLMRNVI